jgi:hypothetical protein
MVLRYVLTLLALFALSTSAGCELSRGAPSPSVSPTISGHLPTDFQRGVNHAHVHRRGHGYGSAASAAELATLKRLGVDWIAVTPFGYQDGVMADGITGFPGDEGVRRDRTLTDDALVDEVVSAHQLGIRVTLKPQLWSRDFWDGNEWHGTIRQTSPDAHARWWASYRAFILHYARLAERADIDLYCIGTELVEMTTRYPEEWRQLPAEVRQVYRGPLTYAAHWEQEFDRIPFWDTFDFIGINAYFPLDAPELTDIEELTAAWRPHRHRIALLQARFNHPVLFLEIGYRPVVGTHRQPWVYTGGEPDVYAQERAYEAVFRAFADAPWWKGTYFWKTFTDPLFAQARGDGMGFSFRGLPAEAVIWRWYGN